MTEKLPDARSRLAALREATPARIFLARAGLALTTQVNLQFQLDHAEARDAVHERLDFEALILSLRARGLDLLRVESAAADRRAYLLRPDLGRRLTEASRGKSRGSRGRL